MSIHSVFQGQRGLVFAIFLASLFVNALILTTPLYMTQLFTHVMASGNVATLIALTIGAGLCLLFFLAFDALRQRLASRLGTRLEAALGPTVMTALVEDVTLREQMGVQPLRDIQDLRTFVSGSFFTALLDAPWSVIFVAVIFLFHVDLGLIALAGVLALFVLGVLSEILGRKPNRASQQATQKVNRLAEEALRNADLLHAMGGSPAMVRRWQGRSLVAMVQGTLASDRIGTLASIARFLRLALQIAMLGWGALLVMNNELAPGLMMAASILLGRAAAPVEQSIAGWRMLLSARASVQRLQTVLDRHHAAAARMELPAPLGHLALDEVSVILPDRPQPLLFGISLDLPPGASLGVIGPSGAGKTTLARALVGLQPLARGAVRIDDSALTDWPAQQIGRHIGFLPQRVELFAGTVAENIALMDDEAAPSAIVEAARRAEVHELILALPQGYNTEVGQMGERLSAGQRQRIGLARAFYGERRLIVLDEPNANLDPEGEEALARAVEAANARGVTVVIVTHRMNILRRVSHVAVLDQGRLARFGRAAEILQPGGVQPMAGRTTPADSAGAETIQVVRAPRPQPPGAAPRTGGAA